MLIVPHLRWRTFRYWAIRASDVRGIGSSPTLGNFSTDFDLNIPRIPTTLRIPLQPYFLSLPAYSIHAAIMYYVYSCIMYNNKKHNKSKRVACRYHTFKKKIILSTWLRHFLLAEALYYILHRPSMPGVNLLSLYFGQCILSYLPSPSHLY